MSVVKVIEIMAKSNESWGVAAKKAVTEATKTVNNIDKLYIEIRIKQHYENGKETQKNSAPKQTIL